MILLERKEGWTKQLTEERYVVDDAVKTYMSEETHGEPYKRMVNLLMCDNYRNQVK
jgi:hypothetical protein